MTENIVNDDFSLTILTSTVNKDLMVEFIKHNEKFFKNPEKVCIAIYIDPWRSDIKDAISDISKTSKFQIVVPDVEMPLMTKYGYYAFEICIYYLAIYVAPNSRNYCVMPDKVRIKEVNGFFDQKIDEADQYYSKIFPDRIFALQFIYETPVVTREYYRALQREPGVDWGVDNIFGYLKKYFKIDRLFYLDGILMEKYIHNETFQTRRGVLMTILCSIHIRCFHRRLFFLQMCKKLFPKKVRGFRYFKSIVKELIYSFYKEIEIERFFSIKKYPHLNRMLDSRLLKFRPVFLLYRIYHNIISIYFAVCDREILYQLDCNNFAMISKHYYDLPFSLYKKIYKEITPKTNKPNS